MRIERQAVRLAILHDEINVPPVDRNRIRATTVDIPSQQRAFRISLTLLGFTQGRQIYNRTN